MRRWIVYAILVISGTVPEKGYVLSNGTLTPTPGYSVYVNGALITTPTHVAPGSTITVHAP